MDISTIIIKLIVELLMILFIGIILRVVDLNLVGAQLWPSFLPGRLAKHPAFGLLLSPAGCLTPPVDFVTDGRTN